MQLVLYTAPVLEPITLAELKTHLRLDSGTVAGNLTTYQTLKPDNYAVANNYTTHVGTAIDVLGHTAVVNLNAGTVGAGGTVDAKIQESDDSATWTDWTGGAFTQVAAANDEAIQEIAYTGVKRYLRVVAKVLTAACDFGVDVVVDEATTAEDADLTDLIADGRRQVETITRRALLTQTWDYYLDAWPAGNAIKIPFGNLQTVTHVKYRKSDWLTTADDVTLTLATDYLVETNGEQCGRIVLPYGGTWPSATLYPSNPIVIRFISGWTTTALIPSDIRRAVKFAAEDAYYHGDRRDTLRPVIDNLLATHRLWDEF